MLSGYTLEGVAPEVYMQTVIPYLKVDLAITTEHYRVAFDSPDGSLKLMTP